MLASQHIPSCVPFCNISSAILERELETVGLRLNKSEPDVVIEKKPSGGVKFSHTVPLTKLGPDPGKTIYSILHEYKMHNAHVVVRQDVTVDEFIDVIEGNRKYIRCLYVYNKVWRSTGREMEKGNGGVRCRCQGDAYLAPLRRVVVIV